MRPAVIALLVAGLATACAGEPRERVATRIKPVAASDRRPIILDAAAGDVERRAYRQGPIVAPRVTFLPCKAQGNAPVSIVEAIVDERGKVVQATVVAGEHGAEVDSAVRSCMGKARLSPALMNGRPVAVVYHLTLSSRGMAVPGLPRKK